MATARQTPAEQRAGRVRHPASQAVAPESHHRAIQRGTARAAVLGVSDGLITNISVVLGMAAARPDSSVVMLAGLVALIAGCVSMASGEYMSMQAQKELFERELEMERRELGRRPHVEQVELSLIYQSRGVDADTARQLAAEMMRDPDLALQTHAREELGIDPEDLGAPWQAATSSFVAFGIGAIVPLLPWFFESGRASGAAVGVSIALAALGCVAVGGLLARATGRSRTRTAVRQLVFTAVGAGVTYALGRLVGVSGVG